MYIGIFWFIDGSVVGFKQYTNEVIPDSLGLVDSEFAHVRDWDRLNNNLGDYEEYPRGRVIFDRNKDVYNIYLDTSLLKDDIKTKILEFFEIKSKFKFKFRKDSHYRTKLL